MDKFYNTVNNIIDLVHKHSTKAQLLRPPTGSYGHIATNLLYILSKQNEQQVAIVTEQIIKDLKIISGVDNVIIKDNFINIWLDYNQLSYQLEQTKDKKTSINLEYCSPNPTGDMHLGHLRVAVFGVVFYNLLRKCGYAVTSELYVNNMGKQVEHFLASIESIRNNQIPEYYNTSRVKELAQISQDPIKTQVDHMLNQLKVLKINFQEVQWESEQSKYLDRVIEILKHNKTIFYGKIPDQQVEGDVTSYKDTHGNFHVLKRSDGVPTYFAMDLAYAYGKKQRGFTKQICILGEDHKGHIMRMKSATKYLEIEYIPLSYGLIMIEHNNQIQPMSKRNNTMITLQEFVNNTSLNNIFSLLLSMKLSKTMVYNKDWLTQSDNTIDQLDYYEHKISQIIEIMDTDKISTRYDIPALNQLVSFVSLWSYLTHSAVNQQDPHVYFDNLSKLIQVIDLFFQNHSMADIYQYCSKGFLSSLVNILKESRSILLRRI